MSLSERLRTTEAPTRGIPRLQSLVDVNENCNIYSSAAGLTMSMTVHDHPADAGILLDGLTTLPDFVSHPWKVDRAAQLCHDIATRHALPMPAPRMPSDELTVAIEYPVTLAVYNDADDEEPRSVLATRADLNGGIRSLCVAGQNAGNGSGENANAWGESGGNGGESDALDKSAPLFEPWYLDTTQADEPRTIEWHPMDWCLAIEGLSRFQQQTDAAWKADWADLVIEEICEQLEEPQPVVIEGGSINGYYLVELDGWSYVEVDPAEERSFSTAVRSPVIEAVLQELE